MKHTELIERLRAGSGGMKHWQELESEAADAIEALQSTLARIEKKVDYLIAERDALKLDAERLTIQLRAAYGHVKGYYMNTCFECRQSMEFVGKRCHTCAACADKRIEAAAMKGAA